MTRRSGQVCKKVRRLLVKLRRGSVSSGTSVCPSSAERILRIFWGSCRARCDATPKTPSSKQEEMRMSKDGLCAIVTGSASGLGTGGRSHSGSRRRASSSIIPTARPKQEATADLCRKAGAEEVVVVQE